MKARNKNCKKCNHTEKMHEHPPQREKPPSYPAFIDVGQYDDPRPWWPTLGNCRKDRCGCKRFQMRNPIGRPPKPRKYGKLGGRYFLKK